MVGMLLLNAVAVIVETSVSFDDCRERTEDDKSSPMVHFLRFITET